MNKIKPSVLLLLNLLLMQSIYAIEITTVDVSCPGEQDGSATVSVEGGNEPYTYAWSNGDTEAEAVDLEVGSISVTVTDANGCTASASATINEPVCPTGEDCCSRDECYNIECQECIDQIVTDREDGYEVSDCKVCEAGEAVNKDDETDMGNCICCSGECLDIDLQNDVEHCGTCDNECATDELCFEGECVECIEDSDCASNETCCSPNTCSTKVYTYTRRTVVTDEDGSNRSDDSSYETTYNEFHECTDCDGPTTEIVEHYGTDLEYTTITVTFSETDPIYSYSETCPN